VRAACPPQPHRRRLTPERQERLDGRPGLCPTPHGRIGRPGIAGPRQGCSRGCGGGTWRARNTGRQTGRSHRPYTRPMSSASLTAPQERILRAAKQVFAARGYRGGSLNDVAALAGYTRAGLRHHYPSKEADPAVVGGSAAAAAGRSGNARPVGLNEAPSSAGAAARPVGASRQSPSALFRGVPALTVVRRRTPCPWTTSAG
jgi:hypothetical protein